MAQWVRLWITNQKGFMPQVCQDAATRPLSKALNTLRSSALTLTF